MRIIIFSAHPDDAESGTGGLCIRASKLRHEVHIIHFTREVRNRRINDVPENQVRMAEGRESAAILGVQVDFLDYLMGECPVTMESHKAVEELLRTRKPDLVLTQWPVDTHPDHGAVGILPLRAYVWHQKFCLGFYEVYTGIQTLAFQPNRLVDISEVVDQKRRAISAHKSQFPEKQVEIHDKICSFRGLEMGVEYAEAFHILGGQTKTTFDDLFGDKIVYKDSGGGSTLQFPEWK